MNTKRTLIAGAAAMLLAAPAFAQQDDPMSQPGQSASQSQPQGAHSAQAMQRDPQMVRQIQQKLQDQGFDVGQIDGMWGPQTSSALKEFQRQQGMDADGKLSQSTVSALGVSMDGDAMSTGQSGQPQSGNAGTAAGATDGMGTGDAQGATGAADGTNRGAGGTGAGTTGTGAGAGSTGGGAGGAAGAGGGAGR